MFTRDLRLHDNPMLEVACQHGGEVVPMFVWDRALPGTSTNRAAYLEGCLMDLRGNLMGLGSDLVVRHGDPVREVLRVVQALRAERVVVAKDVSEYAQRRGQRLAEACRRARVTLVETDSHFVVAPGTVTPSGGDHYKVFTPYWRAWCVQPWRPVIAPARHLPPLPEGLRHSPAGRRSAKAHLGPPGEYAARGRMRRWLGNGLSHYDARHDDLPGDATSRLSADLHFGTISALELAVAARDAAGGQPYLRQLCWRDFHAQVTAAFPSMPYRDYRPRDLRWRDDPGALAAWKAGETGYPIIDAGMRQLSAEGFMHNRARLLTASFLTKNLGVHWSEGAGHFFDLLVDGDVSNNAGNWQWVAGTGNDTRPNRRFNPLRQALRFDPQGDYVRRYVPELGTVEGPAVHQPWLLRRAPRYSAPLVEPPDAPR